MNKRYNKKWKRCETSPNRPSLLEDGRTESYYLFDYQRGTPKFQEAPSGNSAVQNIKKKPEDKGKPGWNYKGKEIILFANRILETPVKEKDKTIFCAMPTSHPRLSPDFDSRLDEVVNHIGEAGFRSENNFDVKENVIPSHYPNGSRDPEEIGMNVIFKKFKEPDPKTIILVDDVVTSGAHFIACQKKVKECYPDVRIVGLFLAKTMNDEE
jgi:hypothetical protein